MLSSRARHHRRYGAARMALGRSKSAVVVNCAAWTAVDDAETHEDAALEVNGRSVADLAAACADHGVTLIHVSTDYLSVVC